MAAKRRTRRQVRGKRVKGRTKRPETTKAEDHLVDSTSIAGGLPCHVRLGKTVIDDFPIGKEDGAAARIVEIDPRSWRAVQLTRQFIEVVNGELNAPSDNEAWTTRKGCTGKVFVCTLKGRRAGHSRIVAACSTEVPAKGYWMIHETGTLVPNKEIPLKIGISRIFTASSYRRLGIGLKLLQAVAEHSFYGLALKPHQIGWSQPSHAGGLLAKAYNGVAHKSGKTLIPVYRQEELDSPGHK